MAEGRELCAEEFVHHHAGTSGRWARVARARRAGVIRLPYGPKLIADPQAIVAQCRRDRSLNMCAHAEEGDATPAVLSGTATRKEH